MLESLTSQLIGFPRYTLIRIKTDRPNISFVVSKLTVTRNDISLFHNAIRDDLESTIGATSHSRVLIFCRSKETCEGLAHLLQCAFYHADVEEHVGRQTLTTWLSLDQIDRSQVRHCTMAHLIHI